MGIMDKLAAAVGLGVDQVSMTVKSPDGRGKITFTATSDPKTNKVVVQTVGMPPHFRGTHERRGAVRIITYAPDPGKGRRT